MTATKNAALALAPSDPLAAARADLAAVGADLRAATFERAEEIEALADCLVAGEHALLLGDPGTGKSYLIRALVSCLEDAPDASGSTKASYFEYLLTRFTEPSEVFGSVDNKVFGQTGRITYLTAGKLPAVSFAFLDETFKASSALLNALLSITNERLFHGNGKPERAPLRCLFGASNETPKKGEGLGALEDRFLVRLNPAPIEDPANKAAYLYGPALPRPAARVSIASLEALRLASEALPVSPEAAAALDQIFAEALAKGIACSDRKQKKIVTLLRARAARLGSAAVTRRHLDLLRHMLWTKIEEIPVVEAIVEKHGTATLAEVRRISGALDEQRAALASAPKKAKRRSELLAAVTVIERCLEEIEVSIAALGEDAAEERSDLAAKLADAKALAERTSRGTGG